MRNSANHVSSWCSAMTVALALTLAPAMAWARVAPPEAADPGPASEPIPPLDPPATLEPPSPVEPPPPLVSAEAGTAPIEGPTPPAPSKLVKLRKAGTGLMATGGVVAVTGFGVVLAFTVIGDKQQREPEPVLADIQRSDDYARIGGILFGSGLALVAIGGILFVRSHREPASDTQARVRVLPTLGGVVLSGEF